MPLASDCMRLTVQCTTAIIIVKGGTKDGPIFLFIFALLFLSMGPVYWQPPISAHEAFYPHHREDFENMARRRQLRGTVILSTIIFVGVVGTIIYYRDAKKYRRRQKQTKWR